MSALRLPQLSDNWPAQLGSRSLNRGRRVQPFVGGSSSSSSFRHGQGEARTKASWLRLLKPRCDAFACNSQYLFHIFKPRLRQIIEVHEPVRQTESPERTNRHLLIARGILNCEPHLLEGHVPMLVLAENLQVGLLQRAEQAPCAA